MIGAAPRVTVTGPLKDLEEKELYADDYGLVVTATPRNNLLGAAVGIRSIEFRVDDVRRGFDSQDCLGCSMTRSFVFAGRNFESGTRRIDVIVTDALGAKTKKRWTVNRSDFTPLPYEAEFVADAKEFRQDFALPFGEDWVRATIHDPTLVPSRKRLNFPITSDEDAYLEHQAAQRAVPRVGESGLDRQGIAAYAEYWWDKTRGGQYGRFSNDCTNFVSQAWHFGGKVDMTKNWYIKKENSHNPFDSNRDWSLSWANVVHFWAYWVYNRKWAEEKPADPTKNHNSAAVGDVIIYDWGRGDSFSHASIALGTKDTPWDLIAQHTTDRFAARWNIGWLTERDKKARKKQKAIVIHFVGPRLCPRSPGCSRRAALGREARIVAALAPAKRDSMQRTGLARVDDLQRSESREIAPLAPIVKTLIDLISSIRPPTVDVGPEVDVARVKQDLVEDLDREYEIMSPDVVPPDLRLQLGQIYPTGVADAVTQETTDAMTTAAADPDYRDYTDHDLKLLEWRGVHVVPGAAIATVLAKHSWRDAASGAWVDDDPLQWQVVLVFEGGRWKIAHEIAFDPQEAPVHEDGQPYPDGRVRLP